MIPTLRLGNRSPSPRFARWGGLCLRWVVGSDTPCTLPSRGTVCGCRGAGVSGLKVGLEEKPLHLPLGLRASVSGEGVLRVQLTQRVTSRGRPCRLGLGALWAASAELKDARSGPEEQRILPDVDSSSIL